MDTLDDLLADEAQVLLRIQALNEFLAGIRIRIAEKRDINRNAITYNLPNELLSAIFEIGRSETSCPLSVLRFDQKPFEILISSVSRRWRNVALHTPQLWTDIKINVSKSAGDLLDLYLHRSVISLLDITLKSTSADHCDRAGITDSENVKYYVERLVPHVTRWQAFSIQNIFIGLLSQALSSLSDLSAPALRKLRVSVICREFEPSTMGIFSGGAPLLSVLDLHGALILPPRGSVRSLEFGHRFCTFPHKGFMQLVRPMQSLINLSIHSNVVSDSFSHSPIVFQSVLSLDFWLAGNHVGVLRSLRLPSLESMTVHGRAETVITAFATYHQSHPALHSLKIISDGHYTSPPAATTRDFVLLFPHVQNLILNGHIHFLILRALKTFEPLWPELSMITIIPVDAADRKRMWDDIFQVVWNRLKIGHKSAILFRESKYPREY
jgi:F-box-like